MKNIEKLGQFEIKELFQLHIELCPENVSKQGSLSFEESMVNVRNVINKIGYFAELHGIEKLHALDSSLVGSLHKLNNLRLN